MKNFAIIGVAGFVAPRHLKAIKDTQNNLLAAFDFSDSVGIMDSYFPQAEFFTDLDSFKNYCAKAHNTSQKIDVISVCSPNYMHDPHCRCAMKMDADVICEKPLVLNPWNLDDLQRMEQYTGHKVYTILQLRLHPSIMTLKKQIEEGPQDMVYDVDLTYITSRGKWYFASWKGNEGKSGGLATNIGVHFYDMLSYVFGNVQENIVHIAEPDRVAGFLRLEKARVRYFLSVNENTLPAQVAQQGVRTYRSIKIGNEEFEFSGGFTDLHTESYRRILEGDGFGIEDVRNCIQIVYDIRNARPIGLVGDYHPLAR